MKTRPICAASVYSAEPTLWGCAVPHAVPLREKLMVDSWDCSRRAGWFRIIQRKWLSYRILLMDFLYRRDSFMSNSKGRSGAGSEPCTTIYCQNILFVLFFVALIP